MQDLQKLLFSSGPDLRTWQVVGHLVVATLLGSIVGLIYRFSRPEDELTVNFPKTLVLLSILIAMVTQVVGDNAARAFSLVGALSIVRFRTVVRDTQDTAYVIFAVAVGMAVGAGFIWVALAGMVIIAATAQVMKTRRSTPASSDPDATFTLSVRVGTGHDIGALLRPTLDTHLAEYRLLSMSTAKQGTSIDAAYETRLRKDRMPDELVKALNRIEGVHDVELRRRELEDR